MTTDSPVLDVEGEMEEEMVDADITSITLPPGALHIPDVDALIELTGALMFRYDESGTVWFLRQQEPNGMFLWNRFLMAGEQPAKVVNIK